MHVGDFPQRSAPGRCALLAQKLVRHDRAKSGHLMVWQVLSKATLSIYTT